MVRRYKKEDIEAIVSLEKNNLGTTLDTDYYLSDLTNSLAYHYVIEEKAKIIGFISTVFDGSTLEILNFVIDKKYQQQGYGTKLLVFVLDSLVPAGLSQATLEVRSSNEKAIHLYKKLGFKQVHLRKGYYADGEDALVLLKIYPAISDIANLEAVLFSKKNGYKYSSNFKERYNQNYYDFYNCRVNNLQMIKPDSFINIHTNWLDGKLFFNYKMSQTYLMHTSIYNCRILKSLNQMVRIIEDYDEFISLKVLESKEYGLDYALKFAKFLVEKHQEKKLILVGAYLNDKLVGWLVIMPFEQVLYLDNLFVLKEYRHQGFASSLLAFVLDYARQNNYYELYLEADVDDTPKQMYEMMSFKKLEKLYEFWKDENGKN